MMTQPIFILEDASNDDYDFVKRLKQLGNKRDLLGKKELRNLCKQGTRDSDAPPDYVSLKILYKHDMNENGEIQKSTPVSYCIYAEENEDNRHMHIYQIGFTGNAQIDESIAYETIGFLKANYAQPIHWTIPLANAHILNACKKMPDVTFQVEHNYYKKMNKHDDGVTLTINRKHIPACTSDEVRQIPKTIAIKGALQRLKSLAPLEWKPGIMKINRKALAIPLNNASLEAMKSHHDYVLFATFKDFKSGLADKINDIFMLYSPAFQCKNAVAIPFNKHNIRCILQTEIFPGELEYLVNMSTDRLDSADHDDNTQESESNTNEASHFQNRIKFIRGSDPKGRQP